MTTYSYTIEIDDSELIMLENILAERVNHLRETNEIFKRLSDDGHIGCEESVLKKLKESYKTAVMTSTSSYCNSGEIKLWSPQK
jgi:hypothetical protein